MELAYKEVAGEVTTGMDSLIRIKLLCQVLPWLHQGSLFPAHSRRCWSEVPASSVPALASPALPEGTCSWGPPSVQEGSSASGPAVPSAKLLEFLQPEAIRSVGKGAFHSKGEGKDKESSRKGSKTLGPWRKM